MLILALGDHVKRVAAGREALQIERSFAGRGVTAAAKAGSARNASAWVMYMRTVSAVFWAWPRSWRSSSDQCPARVGQDVLGLLAGIRQRPPGDVGQPEASALLGA